MGHYPARPRAIMEFCLCCLSAASHRFEVVESRTRFPESHAQRVLGKVPLQVIRKLMTNLAHRARVKIGPSGGANASASLAWGAGSLR